MKNRSKLIVTLVAIFTLMSESFSLRAQNLLDQASNYTSASWINGSDQGTGFGAWSLSSTGGGGRYLGGTGLGTSTFGIFSTSAGTSTAIRPFDTSLLAGEKFNVQLGYTGVANGGEIGLNLWSGSNWRLNLKFVGGQSNWMLSDGGSAFSTGLTWQGNTLLNFEFTRGSSGNQYSLSLTHGSQTFNANNYNSTSGIMDISRVEFYSNNQGNGNNLGFNNLQIVPEPSSASLMALGTAAILAFRPRRNA